MNLTCSTDFFMNRILYQEIDYLREGRNADRFRQDFRKQKWVRVPVSISFPPRFIISLVGHTYASRNIV